MCASASARKDILVEKNETIDHTENVANEDDKTKIKDVNGAKSVSASATVRKEKPYNNNIFASASARKDIGPIGPTQNL